MRPKLTPLQIHKVHAYKPFKLYKVLINLWNKYLIHWCTVLVFYTIFMFLIGLIVGQNLFILFKILFYMGYFLALLYFIVIVSEEQHMKRVYTDIKLSRKDFLKALTMINYIYHTEYDEKDKTNNI